MESHGRASLYRRRWVGVEDGRWASHEHGPLPILIDVIFTLIAAVFAKSMATSIELC